MRTLGISVVALTCVTATILKTGFYTYHMDSETSTVFFVKKIPSLRIEFENIAMTEGDPVLLEHLGHEQRVTVIDYCRYRLGIETTLQTQAELKACSAP